MTEPVVAPVTVRVKVWDAPTRLFHWALVLLFAASWATAETGHLDGHRWSGFAILGLLAFRLGWGVVGGDTARFAVFVRGPGAVIGYAKALFSKDKAGPEKLGHNPMGGWSVAILLLLLMSQTGLGLFATDTDGLESGPLSDLIGYDAGRIASYGHHFVFNALLAFIGLHLLAVASYAAFGRRNLVGPMLTGFKRAGAGAKAPRLAPLWRAAVLAVVAGVLVALIVNLPGIMAKFR